MDPEASLAKLKDGKGEYVVAGSNHYIGEAVGNGPSPEKIEDVVDQYIVGTLDTCGEADPGRGPPLEKVPGGSNPDSVVSARIVGACSVDQVGFANAEVLVGVVDPINLCDRRGTGAVEVVVVEEVEPIEAVTEGFGQTLSNSGANTRSFQGVSAGTHSTTCPVLAARGFSARTLRRTEATVS